MHRFGERWPGADGAFRQMAWVSLLLHTSGFKQFHIVRANILDERLQFNYLAIAYPLRTELAS